MLWDLFGEMAGQVFRSLNTCVKLAWSVPRSSHNYFVAGLAGSLPSVRKKLLCQYVNFVSKLASSVSREVRIMAHVFSNDVQSVTGRNLVNIKNVFNLDPRRDPLSSFKETMVEYQTPESDEWRLPLLRKLLAQRREFSDSEEDTATLDELIDSLCAT